MGVCLATCGAILALHTKQMSLPLFQSIIGAVAVFITVGGMHTLNDFFDKIRDRNIWPNRPIPSGRLSPSYALILALCLLAAGLTLVWIYFNPICFTILLVAVILGATYSRYLRDKVGYLSLPLIVGLHPLGGYAAFAGDQAFTSLTPWVLYFMVTLWQAGHILVYSPAHGLKNGCKTTVPSFVVSLSPKATAALGVLSFSLLLPLSLYLYLIAPLSILYFVIAVVSGCITLLASLKLMVNPTWKNSVIAFNIATLYSLILFSTIALDVFMRFLVADPLTYALGLISTMLVIVMVSWLTIGTIKIFQMRVRNI
jgi:protoheme IX farnesyltransferase